MKFLIFIFFVQFCVHLALAQVSTFVSPNGIEETCKVLQKIPGGVYSKKDLKKEKDFCAIDFYSEEIALCPKTWSTSPGSLVRDLSQSEYQKTSYMSSNEFCGNSRKRKGVSVKNLAKFKTSMNQGSKTKGGGTSGTYSPSSLAYYHLSRYFDMSIKVPVSVYRELDRRYHYEHLVPKGIRNTRSGSKIRNGWRWMDLVGQDPNLYAPYEELVTADKLKYYGILIKGPGERYGAEIVSRRKKAWGKGQHLEMKTDVAAFIALNTDLPIQNAIRSAVQEAKIKSKEMASVLKGVSEIQMFSWMKELSEMIVLDSIFGQQDRVGNIDYRWYWVYKDQKGNLKESREKRDSFKKLSRTKMLRKDLNPPENETWTKDISLDFEPVLIQRTHLNDNDAALRDYRGYRGASVGRYANFPAKAQWVSGLKHFDLRVYKKLMELDQDLQNQGPVYQWFLSQLEINEKSLQSFVERTNRLAAQLKEKCSSLRFDLSSLESFLTKGAVETQFDCKL